MIKRTGIEVRTQLPHLVAETPSHLHLRHFLILWLRHTFSICDLDKSSHFGVEIYPSHNIIICKLQGSKKDRTKPDRMKVEIRLYNKVSGDYQSYKEERTRSDS